MAKYRFSVTYSAVLDVGDINPSIIQTVLEINDPNGNFSLFDAEQVDVDSIEYERVK